MKLSLAHLPQTARDLIDLIGVPATMRLIEHYKGRPLSITRGRRGKFLEQEMGEKIGAIATGKIFARYEGDILSVPNCKRAMLAIRDAHLQERYDALTTQGGYSDPAAVAMIVGEYDLVARSVYRALKRDSANLEAQRCAVERPQLDLFAMAP